MAHSSRKPGSGHSGPQPPPAELTPTKPERDPFQDPIALAIVDVVVERGYRGTTVEEVINRAGVTSEEFHARFADKEDCVLRSFEDFVADWEWRVKDAYASQPDWRSGLRAAAYAVADWMNENPNLVRFGTIEILEAENEMVRVRREQAFSYGATLIVRGREAAPDPEAVPDMAAMMAVGSIVQLLTHRLQSGGDPEPEAMVKPMMYQAVRPYLGEEVAREELDLPRPQRPTGDT
ncbi:MAG: TetR/AcrR family transcriptional regulator [Solirubrobacterales bacterium]